MKKNKVKDIENRGITLVALVVTIVILLILAGVTLNLVLEKNGLIERTKIAVEEYKKEQDKEKGMLNDLTAFLEKNNENDEKKLLDRKEIEVGYKVNYVPNALSSYLVQAIQSGYGEYERNTYPSNLQDQSIKAEECDWKVLSVNNDNSIDLIGIPKENSQSFYLGGPIGYNNGVYLLNKICEELYSNKELGIVARCINIDDIEKKLKDKEDVKSRYSEYGKINECVKKYSLYPKLYQFEKTSGVDKDSANLKTDGIEVSDSAINKSEIVIPMDFDLEKEKGYSQANDKMTVKTSLYDVVPAKKDFVDENVYDLLFQEGKNFWIASRSVYYSQDKGCAYFGLSCIVDTRLYDRSVFRSDGLCASYPRGIFPIVTLDSNTQLFKNDDGTLSIDK